MSASNAFTNRTYFDATLDVLFTVHEPTMTDDGLMYRVSSDDGFGEITVHEDAIATYLAKMPASRGGTQ